MFHLGLRPGHVVLESGTGSGAMSTTIMRSVAPHGHLHTFEFNAGRVAAAAHEFARNGLAHLCTVRHRDVCGKAPVVLAAAGASPGGGSDSSSAGMAMADAAAATAAATATAGSSSGSSSSGGVAEALPAGFDPIEDGSADGVFLDVPEPWLAVPEASRCLKASRKLCSYSPCIEQVMKTCVALRANGFHTIRTIETRLKTYDVAKQAWPVPDFGQGAASAVDLAQPVATPGAGSSAAAGAGAAGAGAGAASTAVEPTAGAASSGADAEADAAGKKRAREEPAPAPAAETAGHLGHKPVVAAVGGSVGEEWLLARPNGSMRGHTAFLTFATRSSRAGC